MLDYQERFYKEIFFPYLKECNIKHGIHLGDLMDRRKYVNFETLSRTRKMFLDPLKDLNITMDAIPGNHDLFDRTGNLSSTELLLSEYDNINKILDPTILTYDNVKFLFLPWITNDNYEASMKFLNENDADVLCSHLELIGFDMYAGIIADHGMNANLFSKFPLTISGHYHHKSQQDNIHYLGAQMEFTWGDADDRRGFHTFDTETKELKYIENPLKIYNKIQYDDTKTNYKDFDFTQYKNKIVRLFVIKRTNPVIFEKFVEKLYQSDLIDLSIMEDYSEFNHENVDISVKDISTKELIEKYIDAVEDTHLDKTRLKSKMMGIYLEALHLEK